MMVRCMRAHRQGKPITGDQEWADGFKGYKKGELAECAEAVFRNPDGDPTLSERARDRLRRWTPPGFAPALVDAPE